MSADTTMTEKQIAETRECWNRAARDWDIQVGDDGDANRRLNSDPVLWKFAGEVRSLRVLDAGCGTGYLCRKLRDLGADVAGVDLSEEMIALAREKSPGIPFAVDSCTELSTLADGCFDLVISNYVLMDLPDLNGALRAFHRVLAPGGAVVAVFSHPCFPQGYATVMEDGYRVVYEWPFPYFEECRRIDPPWAHFTNEFIWYHRPLSEYWKAFQAAGFEVEDFEEPRLTPDRYHLAEGGIIEKYRARPCSVAFRLRKRPQAQILCPGRQDGRAVHQDHHEPSGGQPSGGQPEGRLASSPSTAADAR